MEQCPSCGSYLTNPNAKVCPDCQAPLAAASNTPAQSTKRSNIQDPKLILPPENLKSRKKFASAAGSGAHLKAQEKQADLIIQGLSKYYLDYIRPVEVQTKIELFSTPPLSKIDFFTPPQVMCIGPYSVGKTSFINYLTERKVLGSEIGDQPTTATCHAIMGVPPGQKEAILPGNAVVSDINLPFGHLQKFGINFLNRFQLSYCDSPILDKVTFIDTPGVLSGEKQRINRDYDFPEVIRQFGSHAALILVLFDAHKLDISDEMRDVLLALRGCEDKLVIVLNKADSLSPQSLLRVYGSLMWSLGRVFTAPEALQVVIGSFWAQPHQRTDNKDLLEKEEATLLSHLRGLHKNHSIRLVNDIVKRARQAKTHALIVNQLRGHFGVFTSKDKKKKELLEESRLIDEFKKVQVDHNIPLGDFPKMSRFVETMASLDIHKLPETSKSQIAKIDWILEVGIPTLMRQSQELQLQQQQEEEAQLRLEKEEKKKLQQQHSAAVAAAGYPQNPEANRNNNNDDDDDDDDDSNNPFADDDDGGRGSLHPWGIPEVSRIKYVETFSTLKLTAGRLSGAHAKPTLQQSGLTGGQLKKIWTCADIDKDGYLDSDEYVLCCYLIDETKKTGTVPTMTIDLCPPSKRAEWQ
jgi:GTPase SAR1 family protein